MCNTRLWECDNGKVYEFADKHCVFCKHCADIFYSASGPFSYLCELCKQFDSGCDAFEDDGYKFDEVKYLVKQHATLEARRLFREKYETDPEFKKAMDKVTDKAWHTILFGEPWR